MDSSLEASGIYPMSSTEDEEDLVSSGSEEESVESDSDSSSPDDAYESEESSTTETESSADSDVYPSPPMSAFCWHDPGYQSNLSWGVDISIQRDGLVLDSDGEEIHSSSGSSSDTEQPEEEEEQRGENEVLWHFRNDDGYDSDFTNIFHRFYQFVDIAADQERLPVPPARSPSQAQHQEQDIIPELGAEVEVPYEELEGDQDDDEDDDDDDDDDEEEEDQDDEHAVYYEIYFSPSPKRPRFI